MLIDNISRINQSLDKRAGMDVVIVSVRSPEEEAFFKSRLEKSRPHLLKKDAKLVVVTDDWKGGAGNGLGTLAAYQKAAAILAKEGIDLNRYLKSKKSIALIHTAGEARRLYPLAAFEGGNRSLVKLPQYFPGTTDCLTVLESLIRATALFSATQKGRLSVYFGDQIAIPARALTEAPRAHIDLPFKPDTVASPFEWTQKKLEDRGIVFHDTNGLTHYAERLDERGYQTFVEKGYLDPTSPMGSSLGTFSLSSEFLEALIQEFSKELSEKAWRMQAGSSIFAPLTLSEDAYILTERRSPREQAERHYSRMQDFKKRFAKERPELGLIGVTNFGKHTYFWDYSSLLGYWEQQLKITRTSQEGDAMRMFLGAYEKETLSGCDFLQKDVGSFIKNCRIGGGKIRNSVLFGVTADYIEAQDVVIINSSFTTFKGREALCYHVQDDDAVELEPGTARVDFFLPKSARGGEKEHLKFLVSMYKDPRVDWFVKKGEAPLSLSELEERIQRVGEIPSLKTL